MAVTYTLNQATNTGAGVAMEVWTVNIPSATTTFTITPDIITYVTGYMANPLDSTSASDQGNLYATSLLPGGPNLVMDCSASTNYCVTIFGLVI